MATRFETFFERLRHGELLLADGAWATQLQRLGLELGDCPEEWNVSRPEQIRRIAGDYLRAGADFCLTNTFGANRFRLVRYGFAERVREFNLAGARLSRQVADEFGAVVAASVGPTGEFLQNEGMLTPREMSAAFRQQMEALREGGADCVWIETMSVLSEAELAVQAAAEVGLPSLVSLTFEHTSSGFQTSQGTSAQDAIRALDAGPACALGSNCGNGIASMLTLAPQIKALTKKPVLIKPNADLPEVHGHTVVSHETPEQMAAGVAALSAAGVSILGGCCGTTPEHIRAFRREIDRLKRST